MTRGTALICVVLVGCGEEGCGPTPIDERGGTARGGDAECGIGAVTIPSGALERERQIDVRCCEADLAPPEGFVAMSSMFVFHPIDLAMPHDAVFELAHDAGDRELAIAWRPNVSEVRWAIVDAEVGRLVRGGQDYATVPFDRFGYLMVLAAE